MKRLVLMHEKQMKRIQQKVHAELSKISGQFWRRKAREWLKGKK